MAIPHAKPAEVIDVRPLGDRLASSRTWALIKTDELEVIRLVLPPGQQMNEHRVPGELTLQCIEGSVEVEADGKPRTLEAGTMLYLSGGMGHALRSDQGCSLLLTVLLKRE